MRRYSAESAIDKALAGNPSTHSVIDAIEGQTDSLRLVRAKLMRDIRMIAGENPCVRCEESTIIVDSSNQDTKAVVDTYATVYEGINFLFEVNHTE